MILTLVIKSQIVGKPITNIETSHAITSLSAAIVLLCELIAHSMYTDTAEAVLITQWKANMVSDLLLAEAPSIKSGCQESSPNSK